MTRIKTLELLALMAFIFVIPREGGAAIPEPDHLYYGTVTIDGALSTTSLVEVRLGADGTGELLASGVVGEELTDHYVLRVALEQGETVGEAQTTGVARQDDVATVLVNGTPTTQVVFGGRGVAIRLDLATVAAATGVPPDSDGDGLPDFQDNCSAEANADQVDSNGNGIGDLCEALLNPAAEFVAIDPTDTASASGLSNDADATTGLGAVDYGYEIQTREVTNAGWVDFLNVVAMADPNGLYHEEMASDPRGGILRSGTSGAYTYRVKPSMADKPVNYVSWVDAARYANWLENGGDGGADTETGAFDLTVANAVVNAVATPGATVTLPSEDEWYKAAYYDPTRGASFDEDNYWLYPTREDVQPVHAVADAVGDVSNPGQDVVNYDAVADWNALDGNVTSVGSSASTSYFGASDLGGNVAEWIGNDAEMDLRVVRGGSFADDRVALESTADAIAREDVLLDGAAEGPDVGVRIVRIVPEPGLASMLAWGVVATAMTGQLRRRT